MFDVKIKAGNPCMAVHRLLKFAHSSNLYTILLCVCVCVCSFLVTCKVYIAAGGHVMPYRELCMPGDHVMPT